MRQALEAWEAVELEVLGAGAELEALRRCPVCQAQGADLHAWDQEQFRCECGDCGAVWSVRRCPTCQTRHPWLRPRLREVPVVEPVPGWADHLFGRDVLTLPSPHGLLDDFCPQCAEEAPGEVQAAMMG